MAVTDKSFNGTTITFGGAAVNPLTDYRHTNQPATVRQTGSTDTSHSYGVGRNNQTVTIGFLGSRCPDAAVICNVVVTLNNAQESVSFGAAVTNVNVSGRKDGEIRSSMTVRPAYTTGTTLAAGNRVNIGFDGSSLVAFGSTFGSSLKDAALVSMNYSASAAEIDDAGADDSDVLISPGLPDRTLTWEVMGGPTIAKGTTGSISAAWNDTGTLGTFTRAVIVGIEAGGTLDDAVTTQYTAKEYVTT